MENNQIENRKLIYGCMQLGGGWNNHQITSKDVQQAEQLIFEAISGGITTFDHADIYTFGKAEKVFGEVLKLHSSLREKVSIQTKAGILLGAGPLGSNIYNNSKDYLWEQLKKSLQNLKCDFLDTFFVHRPSALTHYKDLATTFQEMYDAGLVKNFGISNVSASYFNAMKEFCLVPFNTVQLQLSLGHADLILDEMLFNTSNYNQSQTAGNKIYLFPTGTEIQAWGALDKGLFLNDLPDSDEGTSAVNRMVSDLAEKYETTKHAIVLSWLFSLPYNIIPVIGTTNLKSLKACFGGLHIIISDEDWYKLLILAHGNKLP